MKKGGSQLVNMKEYGFILCRYFVLLYMYVYITFGVDSTGLEG